MQACASDLAELFAAFAPLFTRPTFCNALALVEGAILTVGSHTVVAALRALGLQDDPSFANYHRVLARARWDCRKASEYSSYSLWKGDHPQIPPLLQRLAGALAYAA